MSVLGTESARTLRAAGAQGSAQHARKAEVVQLNDQLARAAVVKRGQQEAGRAQRAVRDAALVAERQGRHRAARYCPVRADTFWTQNTSYMSCALAKFCVLPNGQRKASRGQTLAVSGPLQRFASGKVTGCLQSYQWHTSIWHHRSGGPGCRLALFTRTPRAGAHLSMRQRAASASCCGSRQNRPTPPTAPRCSADA